MHQMCERMANQNYTRKLITKDVILQPSYICHIKRSIDESVGKWDIIPEEIESGKYVVDLDYYRENQLIPPLKRIVEKICNDPRSLFMFHMYRVCKATIRVVSARVVRL